MVDAGTFNCHDVRRSRFVYADGVFCFWTAHYGSWNNDARVVFRVRVDTSPRNRAEQKDITCYDRLLPSTEHEIATWHKSYGKEYYPLARWEKE